jgi:hypothetical protein
LAADGRNNGVHRCLAPDNGPPPPRRADKGKRAGKDVTKFLKKLQSPFALVGQGFIGGGLLFWTTRADASSLLSLLPF